jgi:membrane protein involved in colicin uptake
VRRRANSAPAAKQTKNKNSPTNVIIISNNINKMFDQLFKSNKPAAKQQVVDTSKTLDMVLEPLEPADQDQDQEHEQEQENLRQQRKAQEEKEKKKASAAAATAAAEAKAKAAAPATATVAEAKAAPASSKAAVSKPQISGGIRKKSSSKTEKKKNASAADKTEKTEKGPGKFKTAKTLYSNGLSQTSFKILASQKSIFRVKKTANKALCEAVYNTEIAPVLKICAELMRLKNTKTITIELYSAAEEMLAKRRIGRD